MIVFLSDHHPLKNYFETFPRLMVVMVGRGGPGKERGLHPRQLSDTRVKLLDNLYRNKDRVWLGQSADICPGQQLTWGEGEDSPQHSAEGDHCILLYTTFRFL